MRWLLTIMLACGLLTGCPADDDVTDDDTAGDDDLVDDDSMDDDATGDDDTTADNPVSFNFEVACVDEWPADECADGDCSDSEVEQRYADAWELWFLDASGLSAEEMEQYVRLRRVDTWETEGSSDTDIYYELRVDWVKLVVEKEVSAPGGEPTVEQIVDELSQHDSIPQVDFEAPVYSYEYTKAFLDGCAEQYGVTVDPAWWCKPQTNGDPDDDPIIKFRFWTALDAEETTYAHGSIDVMGFLEPRCGSGSSEWD